MLGGTIDTSGPFHIRGRAAHLCAPAPKYESDHMARDDKTNASGSAGDRKKPVVIKKYANRRLYNTSTSSYVTLDHLCQMVKDNIDFAVYDAKTGEDITRSVLTQIIVEEENKGTNLLPINFLRQLIGFYGDNMQSVVPSYLEHMMQAFAANQDRMREQMRETMSGMFPFGGDLQKMSEQNAALFDSAIKMFTPFGAAQQPGGAATGGQESGARDQSDTPGGQEASEETLQQLKQQVDLLQKQLDVLTRQQQGASRDRRQRQWQGQRCPLARTRPARTRPARTTGPDTTGKDTAGSSSAGTSAAGSSTAGSSTAGSGKTGSAGSRAGSRSS